MIGFNWALPHREIPHWKEFFIGISLVTIGILLFRWIVSRLPVLREVSRYSRPPKLKGEILEGVKPSFLRTLRAAYGGVQYMNNAMKDWKGA